MSCLMEASLFAVEMLQCEDVYDVSTRDSEDCFLICLSNALM